MSNRPDKNLKLAGERFHLVGIAGSGMRVLARFLHEAGAVVTGSDSAIDDHHCSPFHATGIETWSQPNPAKLPAPNGTLIHSSAIPASNPERVAAATREIPQYSYFEFIGWLSRRYRTIAVAGTHGKTSVAALITWILNQAGRAPNSIFGGEFDTPGSPPHFQGDDEETLFVVEACEYLGNFLHVRAEMLVVNNIEWDHIDCYPSLSKMREAYEEWIEKNLHEEEHAPRSLILNTSLKEIIERYAHRFPTIRTVSANQIADWTIKETRESAGISQASIINRDSELEPASIELTVPSSWENVLAAIAACHACGVDWSGIREALQTFPGIKRRCQTLFASESLTVINDYAHHPTAIRWILKHARQCFPQRRIILVFEPHQRSRTSALLHDFAAACSQADHVLLLPIFTAREQQSPRDHVLLETLSREIRQSGTSCGTVRSLDQIPQSLDDEHRTGDVLLFAGAGKIDRIAHEFAGKVSRNHAGQ